MWLCIFMACGHYIKISITFLYVLKIVFFCTLNWTVKRSVAVNICCVESSIANA